MSQDSAIPIDCADLASFQRAIHKLRTNEDRVVLRLNCALPTSSTSFHKDTAKICDQFQKELAELRRQRYNILYNCLRENQQFVNLNRDKSEGESRKNLQNAMSNLRFIRNEQAVDEIIIAETDQTVHKRCQKAMIE